MEDQVIVMEESKSSDPDPRYNNINMIFSDRDRFKRIVLASMQLFLLLIVFPALKLFSDSGKKFMAEHYDAMVVLLLAIVLFFQVVLLVITIYHHPVNSSSSIFAILYMLGLSSIASIIEVALVSSTAAVITFSLCGTTITIVVMVNWQEISSTFSEGIKKFMELFVLPCVWAVLLVDTLGFILLKLMCIHGDC